MPEAMTPREAELTEALARANAEIKLLREKIDLLVKRLFGAKSERVDAAQLLLLLQGMDEPGKSPGPVAAEAPRCSKEASPPSCRRKGPRIPEDLPVVEEVIEPEPVKAAPQAWRRIGEEVSERLDYEPPRFLRRRTVRPKYVKRGEEDAVPIVAPLPPQILERSIVGPGLLAQVIVAKYCDHLPLYRQESIYWSRHNVWLPRQTLCDWVELGAEWLRPIYNEIKKAVFATGYVQVDETPLRYLDPGNGKTRQGYLWACGRPGSDVLFHWEPSRAAAVLEKIIPANFAGTIQCDGYEAYDCFARGRGEQIVLSGCMAHVRRKFYEARDQSPRVAAWMLRQFQALYAVEASLRERGADPESKALERASVSRPILERMRRVLVRLKLKRRFTPASGMGRAIDHALRQWERLTAYLGNGQLAIDNNHVENAIRPTAVGKKNWLFIGAADAGERSAILYTVIESCRRRAIDPFAYLRDLFTRLPSATNWQIKELTPEAWARSRAKDLRSAA